MNLTEKYEKRLMLPFEKIQQDILAKDYSTPEATLETLREVLSWYRINVQGLFDEDHSAGWQDYERSGIQLAYTTDDGRIGLILDEERACELLNNKWTQSGFFSGLKAILSHELLHRTQVASTPFEHVVDKEQLRNPGTYSYLSSTREIDAHALEAVEDFVGLGYEPEKIISWLNDSKAISNHAPESNAFWKYWDYFGRSIEAGDSPKDIETWRRFLRRMYGFLKELLED